jgi:hypothetical protein
MAIVSVSEKLEELKLSVPYFNALNADANLYSIGALQLSSEIEGDDNGVRSTTNHDQKVIKFVEKCVEENVDIAVAPEYCLSWEAFQYILSQDLTPNIGKLWILGMQSVRPEEFTDFLNQNNCVEWIYNPEVLQGDGNFLSCACYYFQTEEIKVVVVQFKTGGMGGQTFERDRIIIGSDFYQFGGRPGQPTRLMTLICADALHLKDDVKQEIQSFSHLLFHIQLNKKPRDCQFSLYRKEFFSKGALDTEIFCLNWGNGSKIDGQLMNPSESWGSGFYTKSPELDLSDGKICELHEQGIYNAFWGFRSNVYFLNPNEHVFIARLTKPDQRMSAGQNKKRSGITEVQCLSWDADWVNDIVPDEGFHQYCTRVSVDFSQYVYPTSTVIQIERLLNLTNGLLSNEKWYLAENLESFKLFHEEQCRRFTCCFDTSNEATLFRDKSYSNFKSLKQTIEQNGDLPSNIKDLNNKAVIKYTYPNFDFNIYTDEEKQPAVGCYIGDFPDDDYARKTFDKVYNSLSDWSKRRLVVWYQVNGKTRYVNYPRNPQIDDSMDEPSNSYAREV